MKSIACASVMALLLLFCATTRPSTAQTAGSSAKGSFKYIMEDDLVKSVEFSASSDEKGNATGSMIFNDEARTQFQDVDGVGERGDEPVPFSMTVAFDTLTVEKNRALMSGMIRDSSYPSYVGKWVQLVVEDNALNRELPDKLVWRVCQQQPGGWIPSDYEVPGDRGAFMSWWATDFEQKGDVGIPSRSAIPDEKSRCESLSLWAYSFADLKKWSGDIVVAGQ